MQSRYGIAPLPVSLIYMIVVSETGTKGKISFYKVALMRLFMISREHFLRRRLLSSSE
jgi:hypothetical protein